MTDALDALLLRAEAEPLHVLVVTDETYTLRGRLFREFAAHSLGTGSVLVHGLPSGSIVRVCGADASPREIWGLALDHALLLAEPAAGLLEEIRARLLGRGGVMEVPAFRGVRADLGGTQEPGR